MGSPHKRKRGDKGIAQPVNRQKRRRISSSSPSTSENSSQEAWEVRQILDQRGEEYLLEWEGVDESGEKWPLDWVR